MRNKQSKRKTDRLEERQIDEQTDRQKQSGEQRMRIKWRKWLAETRKDRDRLTDRFHFYS